MIKKMITKNNLPNNPGCYSFKDKKGTVIYIGKAKNLKKRLKSYLQKNDLDIKTRNMLKRAENLEFIITDNEVEALILENTLIKKYQPKYNVRLKDAKNFSYIKITKEKYPRAILARRKDTKGKYFGPFVSASERRYILNFLKRTFRLRTCKKIPKKPCLRFQMNICYAPCIGNISVDDYNKKINRVKKVLSGKIPNLLKEMEYEMDQLSKKKNFEEAKKIRDEINALENLREHQKIEREKKYNEDIINYVIKNNQVYLMIFNIYKGTLTNKNEFIFDYNQNFLEEFLIQYYSENKVPKELIIPKKLSNSIKEFLEIKRESKIKITNPQKGEKKHLLDLVLKNIEIRYFAKKDKIIALKNRLNLDEKPEVIECFDISHLSGTSTVGSMVQFRGGEPYKNNYRRFKIRSFQGIDDTKAIAEVINRRYKRLKNEKSKFPNLIIIDGGKGQLNYSLKELKKLNLNIPIISIAKQFEEIFIPNKEKTLRLPKNDKALHFVQEIRNEAHRFAIKYNRLLRRKEALK
jgi:excinuclease ABC subunit C